MADGEEGEAMAEAKRRRGAGEIVADAGAVKRLRTSAELFDEPLAEIKHQRNGVSSRDDEIATAEVVNANRSGSGSAVEDFGDGEGGLCSDVDEEEFLDETDSEEEEEEEGDNSDEEEEESDVELHASSQNPPLRIEKGIVLDKGKGKAIAAPPPHDYKGKGKAIVQEEDSSDDSEVGVEDDEFYKANMALLGDGDPLEEVDLNNILPTRTRRRTIQQQPVQCVDDPGNGSSEEDEDYVAGGDHDTPGN